MAKPKEIKVYVVPVKGKKAWQLRWQDPVTKLWKQESTGTTDLEKANSAATIKQHDLTEGRGRTSHGRMPWDDFVAKYTEECLAGLAEGTQKLYAAILESVKETVHPGTIGSFTSALASTWQSKIRKAGNAEATINSRSAALKAMLQWAVDREYLDELPKFPVIRRVTGAKRMKGRAVRDDEFSAILKVVHEVVGETRAPEWIRSLNGLWWSGLRIGEAIDLSWDEPERMRVDMSRKYPMLQILAEDEKGFADRLLPIAPEFGRWLLETPTEQRTGPVFHWPRLRNRKGKDPHRVDEFWVIHQICEIGEKANVIVNDRPKKFASAQDFRRSFGERWARKVTPVVLMEMMRHKDISTTMQFYVALNAERTAADLWENHAPSNDLSCDPASPDSKET